MSYEQVPLGAEFLPALTPAEARFKDAITLSPEDANELSTLYTDAALQLIDSQLDEQDRANLRAHTSIEHWRMFGDSNLPALASIQRLQQSLVAEEGVFVVPSVHSRAIEITISGHSPLYETVESYKALTKQKLEQHATKTVQEQGTYQLIASVIADKPQHVHEQPLSNYWKQVKASQAEQTIRAEYGLSDSDPITSGTFAHSALSRSLYHIDSETQSRRGTHHHSTPIDRAKAWFVSEINAYLSDDFFEAAGISRGDITGFDPDNSTFTTTSGDIEGIDCGDDVFDWSHTLSNRDTRNNLTHIPDRALAANFIYNLYGRTSTNPEEMLNEAVAEVVENNYHNGEEIITDQLLLKVRGVPPQPMFSAKYRLPEPFTVPKQGHVSIESKERYESASQRIIGSIALAGADIQRPQLIAIDYFNSHQASSVVPSNWDAKVTIPFYDHCAVRVPGFKLIAREHDAENENNTFYLKQSTHEDLYTGSEQISISAEQRARLMLYYEYIGAIDMADALEQTNELTVDALQNLLAYHSDYTFDQKLLIATPAPFSQLAKYAVNGRLQLQCTGAAELLRSSLNFALPDSQSFIVRGNSIAANGDIKSLGHAQVHLVHEGRHYLLDATPSLSYTHAEGSGTRSNNDVQPPSFPIEQPQLQPAPSQEFKNSTFDEGEADNEPIMTTDEFFKELKPQPALRSKLEAVLQTNFDARNQKELYKILAALPKADPMQRAIAAAIRFDTSNGERDERQSALAYIKNCAKPENKAFRNKFNIGTYDPLIIKTVVQLLQAD